MKWFLVFSLINVVLVNPIIASPLNLSNEERSELSKHRKTIIHDGIALTSIVGGTTAYYTLKHWDDILWRFRGSKAVRILGPLSVFMCAGYLMTDMAHSRSIIKSIEEKPSRPNRPAGGV